MCTPDFVYIYIYIYMYCNPFSFFQLFIQIHIYIQSLHRELTPLVSYISFFFVSPYIDRQTVRIYIFFLFYVCYVLFCVFSTIRMALSCNPAMVCAACFVRIVHKNDFKSKYNAMPILILVDVLIENVGFCKIFFQKRRSQKINFILLP